MLSRQSIEAGPGADPVPQPRRGPARPAPAAHRSGGVSARRTFAIPETRSDGLAELEVRLPAGRYRLWCSLPGHRALGMRATLRVRRAQVALT